MIASVYQALGPEARHGREASARYPAGAALGTCARRPWLATDCFYVLLEMAGFFGAEGNGVSDVLVPLTIALLVGAGDERERTESSLRETITRLGITSP